jgi:hypothetical protein
MGANKKRIFVTAHSEINGRKRNNIFESATEINGRKQETNKAIRSNLTPVMSPQVHQLT